MTNAVLLPYRETTAVELANNRWRKQLLPIGEIEYKGRTLKFTRGYLANLVRSFKEKAFDQVPFQFAGADNKHTDDPDRFRGEIADVELDNDGLYLILEPTEDGAKALKDNPKLGVSARIYENYERSDGKTWRAALQHVLGTLNPHVSGMKPWEAVASLSGELDVDSTLDLTAATITEQGKEEDNGMALSDTDKTALAALLKKVRDGGSKISDDDINSLIDDANGDDDEEELSDDELDKLIKDAEADLEGDEEDDNADEELEPASLSGDGTDALELTNDALREHAIELARVSGELDKSAYLRERDAFVHDYGFPPKLIDLARPLLYGHGHTVELSNGDEIDAGAVMRRFIRGVGKQLKMLDLSDALGNGMEPDDKDETERKNNELLEFVNTARKQFNL
jgi:hypothetical protein